MSSSDFQVQIECGGKTSVLSLRHSAVPGALPVLVGVESEFSEFGCCVLKTMKIEKPDQKTANTNETEKKKKRRMLEVIEYRKKRRELVYEEESEDESTEYTYGA
jgi:hypothetical protein